MSSSSSPALPPPIDTSDPRRFDRVRPFTLPRAWREESFDIYGSVLGSASMISGGAIITRLPQLAYIGLIFALAHLAHHKPLSVRKNSSDSTGGPYMSLAFSLLSIGLIAFQKIVIAPKEAQWRGGK
ncbi:Rba1 protein [Jaminaea rosea]|uniref:Rba1 protein n=1 Tax=Jaminaea rosea TaxID=1569628 RepID=A0A316UKX0_9BASI|nr:Rba1 protein [Jaminaea rosea]PWN25916.1 Rba1 protein [Jaminaea rosea]